MQDENNNRGIIPTQKLGGDEPWARRIQGEKVLESFNDVFADIVNVLLFNGEQVITENEPEEQAPRYADQNYWLRWSRVPLAIKSKVTIKSYSVVTMVLQKVVQKAKIEWHL